MKTIEQRKLVLALSLSCLALSATPALAADPPNKVDQRSNIAEPRTTSATTQGMQRDARASRLIGMNVHNARGENLGEVDELIVDVNNGRVYYAVLAFGGALGLGEKLFAYPVSTFAMDGEGDSVTLNVEEEMLKRAPGFERSGWPDWNRDRYRGDVDRYFGSTVSPKPMPNQQLVRASELIGKDIDDRNGGNVGEIDDLVVNLKNGKVRYAVVDFDRAWNAEDKLVPLSLKAFRYPSDRSNDLVLALNRDQLDMSHGFPENKWPDLNDPAFQRDIDSQLEREGMSRR